MSENTTSSLTCYRHPKRETNLRCSRCENPICVQCAVLTPTGYRCPDCVRNQQKVFDTAKKTDYILSPILAAIISFAASWIVSYLGILTIFISPLVGILIAALSRKLIQRRRSIRLFRVITALTAIGSIPVLLLQILGLILSLSIDNASVLNIYLLLPILWQGLYTILVSTTVFYRLL